jgi:uncharacterized protein (DUF58 family)
VVRRLQFLVAGAVLVVIAFSTGADFLFFLVYLGVLVVGGSYVLTRYGLSDLEAGYTLDRLQAQVGENLRATYTLRNTSRLPKLWLEAYNPSTLPVPLPGRAIALGPRAERTWIARVPLVRRGHFRIDPLVVRTGDPFGLFEASATVGGGSAIIVYPRVESLPRWRLPPAQVEGSRTSPERTLQTTPLVTSIRAYLPGDAYNRIHWKQSARHQDLQVKEFDLEQTADLWVFLDLQREVQAGEGDESTLEAGVRVVASVVSRALSENRAVGFSATAHRMTMIPADRGARQYQKLMQLLAAVTADGTSPLVEGLLRDLPRMRRGMTALVVTPSLERDWIRPLATLRSRGVGVTVCLLDALAYADHPPRVPSPGVAHPPLDGDPRREARLQAARNVRHALAEYDLPVHVVVPARPLGELLLSRGPAGRPARV